MKTICKTLGIVTVSILMYSCSSVKVADSWKDVQTSEIKEKKVLVVNKTDNKTAQIRFEKDMVNALGNNGYNAIESFVKFPEDKHISTLDKEEIIDILKCEGIDVVIITTVQDVKEYKTTTVSTPTYYVSSYPTYYRRGYYRGFHRSYHTVYVDSNPISETSYGKKYILQTAIYDLTQPESEELLSVIITEIDNPETLGTTSKDFAKKVTKEIF